MGKKNYPKFSEHFKKSEKVIEETKNEMVEDILTNEVLETALDSVEKQFDDPIVPKATHVKGVVVNCDKLNVRELPGKDSKILCTINKNDEIQVSITVFGDFYQIITSTGVEGYCMSKYIKIN